MRSRRPRSTRVLLQAAFIGALTGCALSTPAQTAPVIPVPQVSGLRIDLAQYVEVPNGNRINNLTSFGDALYVVNQSPDGLIHRINRNNGGTPTVDLFLDLGTALPQNGRGLDFTNSFHGGAQAVAFHPEFDTNGKFYTSHMESAINPGPGTTFLGSSTGFTPADSVVAEWTFNHQSGQVDTNSYREVFRVDLPVYDHPIKQIGFDPFAQQGDESYGLLYVGHGDSGTQNGGTGQDGSDALGKILRINPLASGGASYTVPATNPFTSDPAVLDEVYATGFRNPHNFSFAQDGQGNSKLIVAGVGQSYAEEVNIVEAGQNYGWREREGLAVNDANNGDVSALPANDASLGYTYPAALFGHIDPIAGMSPSIAIHGGAVVTNSDDPNLNGQYIFGDFATRGKLFHADFDEMLNAVTQGNPGDLAPATVYELGIRYDDDNDPNTPSIETTWFDLFGQRPDTHIGTGPDGEIYLTNKRNGTIYRVGEAIGDPVDPDPDPEPNPFGTLINVDFQSRTIGSPTAMSGEAGMGEIGDQWNLVSWANGGASSTEINLFDSTGAVTTASITVENFSDVTGWMPGANSLNATELMGDGIFISNAGGTATGTISGLEADTAYTLILYAVGDNAARGDESEFEVIGSDQGTLRALGSDPSQNISEPQHYLTFTGMTSAEGEINFNWFGTVGEFAGFNGLQLLLSAPSIPGDTDGDGDIDDADLGTSFSNFTGPLAPGTGDKTAADGDTDGDGDVDDADLGNNFSAYTGPLVPSNVPEPSTVALLGLGGLLATRRRRGHTRNQTTLSEYGPAKPDRRTKYSV
jgi:glucose/arabinose dehydrogenase